MKFSPQDLDRIVNDDLDRRYPGITVGSCPAIREHVSTSADGRRWSHKRPHGRLPNLASLERERQ